MVQSLTGPVAAKDHEAVATDLLRGFGIRPTRPRLAVAALLLAGGVRHVTGGGLHREALASGLRLSPSVVFNTLNLFAESGLLYRIDIGGSASFCTNPAPHHHFFDEAKGVVWDIPGRQPRVTDLPEPPAGSVISGVDVIVRLRPQGPSHS